MAVVVHDKTSGDRHTVAIDEVRTCLLAKRRLLETTDLDTYPVKQLYVHVPYCFFHCSFCVYRGELLRSQRQIRDFLANLQTEIGVCAPLLANTHVDSTFVGGGTVTVLSNAQLRRLLAELRNSFAFSPSGEFTVELAPHGLTLAKLDALIEFGVNRVTMGLQSLDESLLKAWNRPVLPRAHLKRLITAIHARPFADSNVDLMVGVSGRTYENLLSDFRELETWGCHSIMIYIDMRAYRDKARSAEATSSRAMVERLASSVGDTFVLNDGNGVHEYNRFTSISRRPQPLGTRYTTDHASGKTFCLGLGPQAKSWNREMLLYWH